MIDPELTKVLGRRILASVINLAVVGAVSLMVISVQAQRFVITQRNAEGNPVWPRYSPEGLRLTELDQTFNRALTIGDNFYVWNTAALFVSLLILTLTSLVVWVLIPASIGWSPGHRLLGLKVVTIEGEDPPLDGYLRRYVVGLIDLFPFVLPGLLGWLTASRNEHSQRIGDLSGDTVVIDANSEIRLIDAKAYVTRQNQMVDVEGALGGEAAAPTPTFSPDQVIAEAEAAQASPWTEPTPEPELQDLYIPTHIEPEPEPVAVDELAEGEIEADDSVPGTPDTDVEEVTAEASAEIRGAFDDAMPVVNPDDTEVTWAQPVSEPAPVWEPTPEMATEDAPNQSEPAEPGAPAESVPVGAAPVNGPTGDVAPTWSDDWQAWLFWDHVNERWLRHVEESDSWLPIN